MAKKILVLVRHGQYKKKPVEKLTSLGIKQARLAGRRLRGIKFNKAHFSTMPRAQETAEVICKALDYRARLHGSDLLHECVPGFPKDLQKKYKYTDTKKLLKDRRQADLAFKNTFTFSKTKRIELVVCHGNIIRYFLCKALGNRIMDAI